MYGVGYDGAGTGNEILYEINKKTGKSKMIGDTNIHLLMDLAFDLADTLYGTANDTTLWTIDTSSGASTLYGSIEGILDGNVMGIMFDPNDILHVLHATVYTATSPLYVVDLSASPFKATIVGYPELYFPHGGDFGCPPAKK